MMSYAVYGECLRSELHFPELPEIQAAGPRWRLRLARSASSLDDAVLLGTEALVETVMARLQRGRDRFRLSLDDTGIFDVALDGHEIAWTPAAGAEAMAELARADVLGRALPIAMHAAGELCLHASAVAADLDGDGVSGSRAIGFLADRGFGKSTLALALVGRGARLLSDDGLRIVPGTPALAMPSFPGVRLRPDAARRLGREHAGGGTQTRSDGKLVLRTFESRELMSGPAPLAALYLLEPVSRGSGRRVVQRRRVSVSEGALAIVRHGKVASLLGGSAGGVQLRLGCALAECTPVYRLEIVRDLTQLGDAADQLLGWHRRA